MKLLQRLDELNAENTGRINTSLDSRIERLNTIATGDFIGKVYTTSDLKNIISSMKEDDERWKSLLFGRTSKTKKSPKEMAQEIEGVLGKLSDKEIEDSIPENNPDGDSLSADQKKVYEFIDTLEERFQKISIGDYDSLFRAKSKRIANPDGSEAEDEEIPSDAILKKRISNIIPIKVNALGMTFYGIVRPGSSDGSNGIVTWQKIADSFSVKMDNYDENYKLLSAKQKEEYDAISKDFATAKKLPRTIPLIQRNTSGSSLKIHATEEIKNLKSKGLIEYDDDPSSMQKIGGIIVDIIKESGKSFAGQPAKALSKEQVSEYLGLSATSSKVYDLPTWVISSTRFWNEIEKFF